MPGSPPAEHQTADGRGQRTTNVPQDLVETKRGAKRKVKAALSSDSPDDCSRCSGRVKGFVFMWTEILEQTRVFDIRINKRIPACFSHQPEAMGVGYEQEVLSFHSTVAAAEHLQS